MQYNPEEYKEILNIFKVESEEIIQSLNDGFLELEKNPEDKTPLKKLFQNAHSIKGAARMLGFNGIQDIAHKLEDILSFWKQEDIKIDSDSFEVIYEVCDFLLESVSKSVENQADYFDVNVVKFLNRLDKFIQNRNDNFIQNNNVKSAVDISNKITDINAIILELLFLLQKDDENNNFEEIFMVVSDNISSLDEIFKNSGYSEIKKHIDVIKTKLASNSADKEILDVLQSEIVILKNEIYNEFNVNFQAIKPKKEKKTSEEVLKQESPANETDEKFDYLLKNLMKIKQDKKYVQDIKPKLEYLQKNSADKNINKIISKIINILELFQNGNKIFDNDCYMTILQGIYLAKKLNSNEKAAEVNNFNSLMQRLDVVQDMLNLTPIKSDTQLQSIKSEVDSFNSGSDFDKIKKNLSAFEMQEIKTLRVDTSKIDNLISQTGELLINGIKNREHLSELSNISMKLIQWNSTGKKITSYLKYLEKKGFFSPDYDESSSLFYKKIQNFLFHNTDIILDLQNDFGKLYNIISEDDNKLHQTVMEIENIAKGIRILPLATIFHSFPRMIRDIAIENNKKIDFIVTGSDTTVDKKLIEEIKMPLIHILRNAVSHGIEEPDERIKNGKPEVGTIKLIAKQEDNNVVISIEDDGYGINLEKVKKSAVKNGILLEEEVSNLSNEQLMKLLFLPGFSTNESIDEISGRGIGLDIVKTKINNLNGDIQIDSVLNKGCKVTIKLPLAMSTLKTFIILINGQKYAIPVNAIKFVKKIKKDEIFIRGEQNYIIYDEHSVPIYRIADVFCEQYSVNTNEDYTIIIVENHERQAAFIIDKLLGDQEVFHKKLVPPIIKIRNISGFTTLSTGEICLIINPYDLIRNTVMNANISSFNVKQAEIAYDKEQYKNKKILLFNNGSMDFIKNDLSDEFINVTSFDNIYTLYNYFQKNNADAFICKMNDADNELLKFLQYIKNDEILNKIKIIILSDLISFDLLTVLNHFKPDLHIKTAEYEKESFINTLKQKI